MSFQPVPLGDDGVITSIQQAGQVDAGQCTQVLAGG